MTEIKLNEWRWGVVPRLDGDAVLMIAGPHVPSPQGPWRAVRFGEVAWSNAERWYAVLSLGPPAMPEPELRLPEGWEVSADREFNFDGWAMEASTEARGCVRGRVQWFGKSRRECIEEINRILGGGK